MTLKGESFIRFILAYAIVAVCKGFALFLAWDTILIDIVKVDAFNKIGFMKAVLLVFLTDVVLKLKASAKI